MFALFLAVALQAPPPSEGDVVNPKVTVVTEFGCYVDLGLGPEWSALVHVSDLSWGRLEDPGTICKVGKRLRLKVLKVHGERVKLSAKDLTPDPWDGVARKYPIGRVVQAKVTALEFYGVWLELEHGIDALVRTDDIPPARARSLKVGRRVKVIVVDMDLSERRMFVALHGAKTAPVKKNDIAALDDLYDVVPNLSASLSVLEPMAVAGRIDDRELRSARDMARLVAADVEVVCKVDRARPDEAACTRARADVAAIRAALNAPTAPALLDAGARCRALRDQLPSL